MKKNLNPYNTNHFTPDSKFQIRRTPRKINKLLKRPNDISNGNRRSWLMKKRSENNSWHSPFKGTVSWDFLLPFFSLNQFILVPLEMSFDFFAFSLLHFKKESQVLWKPGSRTLAEGKKLPGFQSTGELWLSSFQSTGESGLAGT